MEILVPAVTFIVLGVVGSVVGPLVDDWVRRWIDRGRPRPSRRAALFALVGALAGVGTSLGVVFFTIQAFGGREPEVQIVAPSNNATMKIVDETCKAVQGSYEHLDPDQEIWLVVTPAVGGGYFPQGGPAKQLGDDRWSSTACLWGEGRFDILAVVATNTSSRTAFAVRRDACAKGCPPVERLWDGTVIKDGISVAVPPKPRL
jgi:hypothetical protein